MIRSSLRILLRPCFCFLKIDFAAIHSLSAQFSRRLEDRMQKGHAVQRVLLLCGIYIVNWITQKAA